MLFFQIVTICPPSLPSRSSRYPRLKEMKQPRFCATKHLNSSMHLKPRSCLKSLYRNIPGECHNTTQQKKVVRKEIGKKDWDEAQDPGLKSWGSQASPSATLLSKSPHKISHFPWFEVSNGALPSFVILSNLTKKVAKGEAFNPHDFTQDYHKNKSFFWPYHHCYHHQQVELRDHNMFTFRNHAMCASS